MDEFDPWSEDAKIAFQSAGQHLAGAIVDYCETISGASTSNEREAAVFRAADRLASQAAQFADAQINFTGIGYPLDTVATAGDGEPQTANGQGQIQHQNQIVSVRARYDYAVIDAAAVAGVASEVLGEDVDQADLGRALYGLIASKMPQLSAIEALGLRPIRGVTMLVDEDEPLSGADLKVSASGSYEIFRIESDNSILYSFADQYPPYDA